MYCKLCLRAWDTDLILPEVLLPCAHTFCSECLNQLSDSLSCPDCGNLICARKINSAVFELVNHESGILLYDLLSHLDQIELSESRLQLSYEIKLQNIEKKIAIIEKKIENQVRSQIEVILSNQANLRNLLEKEKMKINHSLKAFLNEDELVSAKIELIKSNLKSSANLTTFKIKSFINDLRNVFEQRNAKLKRIETINLNLEFESNDLIIINSKKIVGQIVVSSDQRPQSINTLTSPMIEQNLLESSLDTINESQAIKDKHLEGLNEEQHMDPVKKLKSLEFFNRGNKAREAKNFTEALKMYDKAIEFNPFYSKAYNNKGNIHRELNDLDEAIKCFDKTLKIDPNYIFGYNNKGICHYNKKEYDKAIESFDSAIKINPSFSDAQTNKQIVLNDLDYLEYSNRMEVLSFKKKSSRAENIVLKTQGKPVQKRATKECKLSKIDVTKASSFRHEVYFQKGKAAMKSSDLHGLTSAIKLFDQAISLNAEFANAYRLKGIALNKMKKYEEAISSLDKAIELTPTTDKSNQAVTYSQKGFAFLNCKRYKKALKYVEKALERMPTYKDAIFYKQMILKSINLDKNN